MLEVIADGKLKYSNRTVTLKLNCSFAVENIQLTKISAEQNL